MQAGQLAILAGLGFLLLFLLLLLSDDDDFGGFRLRLPLPNWGLRKLDFHSIPGWLA